MQETPASAGSLDPMNWRIRATEDIQNVAPEKNNVRKTIYVTDVDQQVYLQHSHIVGRSQVQLEVINRHLHSKVHFGANVPQLYLKKC